MPVMTKLTKLRCLGLDQKAVPPKTALKKNKKKTAPPKTALEKQRVAVSVSKDNALVEEAYYFTTLLPQKAASC